MGLPFFFGVWLHFCFLTSTISKIISWIVFRYILSELDRIKLSIYKELHQETEWYLKKICKHIKVIILGKPWGECKSLICFKKSSQSWIVEIFVIKKKKKLIEKKTCKMFAVLLSLAYAQHTFFENFYLCIFLLFTLCSFGSIHSSHTHSNSNQRDFPGGYDLAFQGKGCRFHPWLRR